ncbi:MAG: energy-coupling factor transporter transmembrane protein EcfT [Eubacteriales bacterium]|nr:energy-coupling factor transporter transmembrane protein EcfT [Eubacteriales bacterium]
MSALPAGQFFPGQSVLHALDARAKLLGFFLLLAGVVCAASLPAYAVAFAAAGALLALSRLPARAVLAPLKRLWLFFVLIFAMNALFYERGDALWSWWIFRLSKAGMAQGANVAARVALMMVLSGVLTGTTAPMEITGALNALFKPLALLGIPAQEIAMILGIAIQFIPTLLEETDTIRKAQIARGARFESRSLWRRAASLPPLVVPIFLSAFRRADDLATAMEARGYRGAANRTHRRARPLRRADWFALALCTGVCALHVVLRVCVAF